MASPAREATKKKQQKKPLSITQVIAAAADVVIAQPLLIIVPILLDLYYLVGWRLTGGHTFDRLQTAAHDLDTSQGERLAEFVESASRSDLTGIVSFVIPSFLAGASSEDIYHPIERGTVSMDNWGATMLAVVVLIGLSMCLFGVFGLWLADTGLHRERSWGDRFRLGPVIGGRFVLLVLLVVAMVLLLCVPLFVALGIAAFVGIGLEGLVLSISVLIGIALYVLFYFAPDSLLVELAGPVHALRASSAVVRSNLFTTLGFAVVSIVISIGLADIWDRVATNAPGLAIAIVANAFVGCILWIASLLFFSERSNLLASERAASSTSPSIM